MVCVTERLLLPAERRSVVSAMSEPFTLSEHESKQRLSQFGLVVTPEALAADAAEAVLAAEALGYPVVVKACGRRIAHKTERGLVRLSLGDETAVGAAAHSLLDQLTEADGDDACLLVASMVRATRELIVGVTTDPSFGRVIMIGIGGIFAEVVADVSFRLLPLNDHDAAAMIDDLASQDFLGSFRGEAPIDRSAVAATLIAVARCAEADPNIEAIDVNPLLVVDGVPVAVDALVVTR